MFDVSNKENGNREAPGAAGSSLVPSITLPKGGGAIRSIGEKFGTNPATGTGALTIPIFTTPGRSDFSPKLSLAYDSGSGNGLFGFGWQLSIPSITRKTDKGLPRYEDTKDSDVFILSAAEDLVPVFKKNLDGEWKTDSDGNLEYHETFQDGYSIRRYRPRSEGLFARIERWHSNITGQAFWKTISKDNITSLYGQTNNSRIFDPEDPSRIYSWLLDTTHDDKGNVITYEYKPEDTANVPSALHEQNHKITANRYLKSIHYGNRTPPLYLVHKSQGMVGRIARGRAAHPLSNPSTADRPGDQRKTVL